MSGVAQTRIRQLLDDFCRRAIDVETFCTEFERTYNLELEKRMLSPTEAAAYAALFEQVIWFSPFEEERRQVPNYTSEADIEAAAEAAATTLKKEPSS